MKLALILANAASQDLRGTVSAIGLGVTRLQLNEVPGHYRGSMVLIASPEDGDAVGETRFELTLKGPGQDRFQQFAIGAFDVAGPREQVIMNHDFEMLMMKEGAYVFRFTAGNGEFQTHLVVSRAPRPRNADAAKGST